MTRWFLASCLIIASLVGSLVALPWSAQATHGGPFPLPAAHSQVAAVAEHLEVGQAMCPQGTGPFPMVRFDAAGYHWTFAFTEDTNRGVFIQFPLGEERPLRVWVFTGTEDTIHIVAHFEDPAATLPGGPCDLLYPQQS